MNARRLIPIFSAFALVAAASAQAGKSFDFLASDIRVLQDRGVQNDMKVTEAQRTKMNGFAKQHDASMAALRKRFEGQQINEAREKELQTLVGRQMARLKDQVLGVLTPVQLKRLREITLQGYGYTAVADERVAQRVGLSADQLKRVRGQIDAGRKDIAAIERRFAEPILKPYQGKKPKDEAEARKWQETVQSQLREAGQKAQPQLRDRNQKMMDSIRAILTPAQRQTFVALLGTPYKRS